MDKQAFFTAIRRSLFDNKLSVEQVSGIDAILAAMENRITNAVQMAYVLATAYHETGRRMIALREGFARSDTEARKIVKRMGYKYATPDPVTGHVYYGRGHVQLTWADNYKRMGARIGVDLYRNPDLALDVENSAKILVDGMEFGLFTGKGLGDYFFGDKNDPVNARRIINGVDKAEMIAGYHDKFLAALKQAGVKA